MPSTLSSSVSMLSNLKINDILKVDPKLEKFQKHVSLKITLKKTENDKKYAISSLNLPVGTCVHEEKAVASVLKTDFQKSLCNRCFGYFERDAKNPLKMPNIYISEGEENRAIYCSSQCRDEAKPVHNLISPFLHLVTKIAKDNGFEVDILRLVVTILAQNKVNNDENHILNLIEELPAYEEKDVVEIINWYKKLERCINELYPVIPEDLKTSLSQEKLYEIASKVCNYALSPCDQGHYNPDVGLALYPITSLFFRQSCDPNCTLTYRGNNVEIYTIKPVKVGEELCISCVDLYQSRYERGQEIFMKTHEWCECSRCKEDITKSVDRYLCGLLCDECKKDVYPVDSNGYHEYLSKVQNIKDKTEQRREKIRELVKNEFEKIQAEQEAAAKAAENAGGKTEGQAEASTTENESKDEKEKSKETTTSANDMVAQAKEATRMFFKGDDEPIQKEELKIIGIDEKEVYTCPSCQHQRNKVETLTFLQRVSDHFTIPMTYLQNGQFSAAEEFFNRILDRYSKFLHPQSYYLMNARVQLLNCYINEERWDDCISLIKNIIDIKEKSKVYTTKYTPELIDLYDNLGDYCTQSLEAKKSDILNASSSNSDIRKKYLNKERSKAYNTCLELRTAVYGKDHPKTLAIQRKVDAL
ncbi:hypothetical protein U3516DRAFT_898154 [Neocallimastix sp. 'constans']